MPAWFLIVEYVVVWSEYTRHSGLIIVRSDCVTKKIQVIVGAVRIRHLTPHANTSEAGASLFGELGDIAPDVILIGLEAAGHLIGNVSASGILDGTKTSFHIGGDGGEAIVGVVVVIGLVVSSPPLAPIGLQCHVSHVGRLLDAVIAVIVGL